MSANGPTVLTTAEAIYLGADPVQAVYLGDELVWPLPVLTYYEVVLADNPIGFWPLDDAVSNAHARNLADPNPALRGSYSIAAVAGPSLIPTEPGRTSLGPMIGGPGNFLNLMASVPSFWLGSWTAEMWVNLTAYTNASLLYRADIAVRLMAQAGGWSLAWGGTSSGLVAFPVLPLSTTAHVMVTCDHPAQRWRLYMNGTEIGTATLVPSTNNLPNSLIAFGDTQGARGTFQALSIYDRALTAADVTRHYNAGMGT